MMLSSAIQIYFKAGQIEDNLQSIFEKLDFDNFTVDVHPRKVYDNEEDQEEQVVYIKLFKNGDIIYIEHFKITDSCMKSLSVDKIYTLFSQYAKLKSFFIYFSVLPLIFYEKISLLMKEHHGIKLIGLLTDNFTDGEMKYICEGLLNSRTLQTLFYRGATISGEKMLVKAILSIPHTCLYDAVTDFGSREIREIIYRVGKCNELAEKDLTQGSIIRIPTDCSLYTCIRCYDLATNVLAKKLSEMKEAGTLQLTTSVFVYNTQIDLAFLQKWFNEDGIGADLETVALIKCRVPSPYEFFLHPEHAGKFPKLKIINITESSLK